MTYVKNQNLKYSKNQIILNTNMMQLEKSHTINATSYKKNILKRLYKIIVRLCVYATYEIKMKFVFRPHSYP